MCGKGKSPGRASLFPPLQPDENRRTRFFARDRLHCRARKRSGRYRRNNPECPCFRRNHRFRQRQIFKDSSWRIDFSEDVAVVWDDSEVTILDCLDDLLEIAHAEVIDISVESPLSGRFHYFLEKICSLAANSQPDGWNCFPSPSPVTPPPGRNHSDGLTSRDRESQKDWNRCRSFHSRRERHLLEAEDLVIGRIDYDFDLIWLTTARRIDPLAREIHRQHEICKADTPLLQSL